MPNLRATTSKEVTHAMMTINHPDVRAIHSSGRRKPSDTFNRLSSCLPLCLARIAATCRPRAPLRHSSLPPWLGSPADQVLTQQRAPRSLYPAREARGQQHRYRVAGATARTGGWPAQPQATTGVRLLAAQIGRLDHLRVAPDGVLLTEVEVVVGDFLERLVLGRLVPDHLEPRLLEGG